MGDMEGCSSQIIDIGGCLLISSCNRIDLSKIEKERSHIRIGAGGPGPKNANAITRPGCPRSRF